MERAFKIGCSVVFFDSLRQPHEAVVTSWFHGGPDGQTVAEMQKKHDAQQATNSPEHRSPFFTPSCNVAFVSDDTNKHDTYGRQLERATSCTYGRNQGPKPFLGMCWCWPDELEEAMAFAAKAI